MISNKMRAVLWALLVGLCLVLLWGRIRDGVALETNILELLPVTEQDPVVEHSFREFGNRSSNRVVFLVGHSDEALARAGAECLIEKLTASGAFSEIIGKIDEASERAFYDLYFPHRYHLLNNETRQLLQQPKGARDLTRQAMHMLHTPMSSMVSGNLDRDPLLLFPAFLRSLPTPPGAPSVEDGFLVKREDGTTTILVTGTTSGSAFSRSTQNLVSEMVRTLKQDLRVIDPEIQLSMTGVLFFAQAGANSAQREVTTIGLGSLLGIIILVLYVFRSSRPLFLCVLAVLTGCLFAFTVCLLVFSRVHVITIGFGASLVGVCIDYAFHFFSDRLGFPKDSRHTLRRIFPGIGLGALTSVIGYLGLAVAPFPGLRQMAVFSTAGLLGAFGTVVFWFPVMAGPSKTTGSAVIASVGRLLNLGIHFFQRKLVRVAAVFLLILATIGLTQLRFSDDVRQLQALPQDLKQQEAQVRSVIGAMDNSRFLIVEGQTPEDVLLHEEALLPHLEELRGRGVISFFQNMAAFVPSRARQQADFQLLQAQMWAPENPVLKQYMIAMGFDENAISAQEAILSGAEGTFLDVPTWLASPASQPLRHLWLGTTERGFASIILLGDVADPSGLLDLEARYDRVTYVDKVGDISGLLGRYRVLMARLVALSYLLIFCLLFWRYGIRQSFFIIVPPILAAVITLVILGWFAETLNLFHILALLLVLGVGIDYTIFLAEAKQHREVTALAILLSGTTTILSFGLLAFSETSALAAFGATVLCGICWALLLAPLAVDTRTSP